MTFWSETHISHCPWLTNRVVMGSRQFLYCLFEKPYDRVSINQLASSIWRHHILISNFPFQLSSCFVTFIQLLDHWCYSPSWPGRAWGCWLSPRWRSPPSLRPSQCRWSRPRVCDRGSPRPRAAIPSTSRDPRLQWLWPEQIHHRGEAQVTKAFCLESQATL